MVHYTASGWQLTRSLCIWTWLNSHVSTITVEATITIQTWKKKWHKSLGTALTTYRYHQVALQFCNMLYAIFLRRLCHWQLTTCILHSISYFHREFDSCWIYKFISSERVWISDWLFFVNSVQRSWHTCAGLYKVPSMPSVHNSSRTNRITFETKKIEEKRAVLSIGRTRVQAKGTSPGWFLGEPWQGKGIF